MKQRKGLPANWRGFTLLELLVSAGVISIVSVIITQVLFSSIHLNTKTEVIKELKQTGEMTMGVIARMIQNAGAVTCNASTYITITGLDGGITTLECIDDAGTGVTRIASVSASTLYLTNSNVTLIGNGELTGCTNQPLEFICASDGGVPNSISVSFRLRQKNLAATSYESAVETFQTTISLRNNE